MPQVQDRSFKLLICSPVHNHCATTAPFGRHDICGGVHIITFPDCSLSHCWVIKQHNLWKTTLMQQIHLVHCYIDHSVPRAYLPSSGILGIGCTIILVDCRRTHTHTHTHTQMLMGRDYRDINYSAMCLWQRQQLMGRTATPQLLKA